MFPFSRTLFTFRSDPFNETEEIFPSGTEITFNCIPNAANERSTWKLFCEDGEWVGRAINCGLYMQINENFGFYL